MLDGARTNQALEALRLQGWYLELGHLCLRANQWRPSLYWWELESDYPEHCPTWPTAYCQQVVPPLLRLRFSLSHKEPRWQTICNRAFKAWVHRWCRGVLRRVRRDCLKTHPDKSSLEKEETNNQKIYRHLRYINDDRRFIENIMITKLWIHRCESKTVSSGLKDQSITYFINNVQPGYCSPCYIIGTWYQARDNSIISLALFSILIIQ